MVKVFSFTWPHARAIMDDEGYYEVELLARSGQKLVSLQIHNRRLLSDLLNSIYAQAFGLEYVFDLEDYLQQELYASLPLVLLSRFIHEQKLETRIEEYVKSSLRSSNGSEAQQKILKVRLTKQPPETQEILRNFIERVEKIRQNNKQFFANDANETCGIKINKIEPNAGSIFGGEKVLIRGENFEGNYCVRFGATIVPSKLVDPKTLECITPSHSSGPVTVSICPLSMTNTSVAWLLGPIFTFVGPSASCPLPLACPAEGGAPLALTSPCRTNDLTVAPPIAK